MVFARIPDCEFVPGIRVICRRSAEVISQASEVGCGSNASSFNVIVENEPEAAVADLCVAQLVIKGAEQRGGGEVGSGRHVARLKYPC